MTSSPPLREASPPFGAPLTASVDAEVEKLLAGVPEPQATRLRDLIRLSVRRTWSLQRLQAAGSALSRTLEPVAVIQELARGVQRTLGAEGVFVVRPDLDAGLASVLHRAAMGVEPPLPGTSVPLSEGAVVQAARSGEPVQSMTPTLADRAVAGDDRAAVVLAAPILHGRRLLGVVGAWALAVEAFDSDDLEALRVLASQAAIALSNAQLYAESEGERRQSEAMAAAARAVGESLRMGEVLRLILRHATALLRAEGGGVALLEGEYLNIVAAVGAGELLKGVHLPVVGSVAGRVVREGVAAIMNDAAGSADAYRVTQRLASIEKIVNVPLTTARGPLGILSVFNREDDFTDSDVRVLQRLADQVTVAIVNARLYEELSDATREWSSTFDGIGSAMVIVDERGRIAKYNARALQLANLEGPRELVGRPFYETFLGQTPSADDDLPIERAMREGVTVRGMLPAPARDTALRVSAAPHANGGAIVTLEEERTAPHVLDRSARVLEAASDALLTLDRQSVITSANPAARHLFQRDDLEGTALDHLIAPGSQAALARDLQQTLIGASVRGEYRLGSGPEPRVVEASLAPLSLAGGVDGVVVWLRDVSRERSRAEALARSEARYAQLVEMAPDAIVAVDTSGNFTALNKTFEDATGLAREAMLGRHVTTVIDPRDRELAEGMFRTVMGGQVQRFELRFVDHHGETGWASITASPIMSAEAPTGVLAVVRNITGEKRVVEQLLRQERMAAVGHLVSGLSHELNNPLASVMALAELLLESDALPGEARENARMILDEARRAAKIIGNLLAFARQQPAQKAPVDVNVIVAQALDMRRYALQLDNVTIDLTLTPHLPPVLADVSQLQQVLLNLIANAEQAVRAVDRERRLSLRTARFGSNVTIAFQDNGLGISGEDRDRIFDPFFTTRGVGQGAGLGLSVADGIVREHGGRIHVDSTPGAGATFIVELPVASKEPETSPPSREWPVPNRLLAILVVDDEPTIREALTRFLVKLGHRVDQAANGIDARLRLASRTYDRILLDVRMPGLAGDMLYREIAERSPAMARRVVFLTGDSENSAVQAFLSTTARPCLTKPFSLDDVHQIVHDPTAFD